VAGGDMARADVDMARAGGGREHKKINAREILNTAAKVASGAAKFASGTVKAASETAGNFLKKLKK